MVRGLSLANKCQLLFGFAVTLVIIVVVIVPWARSLAVVDKNQIDTNRDLAALWTQNTVLEPRLEWLMRHSAGLEEQREGDLSIRYWPIDEWHAMDDADGSEAEEQASGAFLRAAHRQLATGEGDAAPVREYSEAVWDAGDRVYRFAGLVRAEDGTERGVVVVERRSATAMSQLITDRAYLIAAGLFAGIVAILIFYLITTRIILSPVRSLRDTADMVREGNLHIRSDIRTGDEFEQLSEAFNLMLEDLATQQAQLRGINHSLDLKLTELAERNLALFEAMKLKGDFLANVSHELRTPLNSIIGFAEILQDIAQRDADTSAGTGDATLGRRARYLDNILTAGRSLLVMINELLEMAKIEAGRIELHVQPMNVAETCEGLLALIRPLAEKKDIRLVLQLPNASGSGFVDDPAQSDLPLIETDQQKFQQIVFNFLSNAVKFTPEHGTVRLRAERMIGGDSEVRLRVSVLDDGPGIPPEQRESIFEKFRQLDGGHTREHQGTGLGLAIAREFARLLGGEVHLVSESGRGSMFSVVVPLTIDRLPEGLDGAHGAARGFTSPPPARDGG